MVGGERREKKDDIIVQKANILFDGFFDYYYHDYTTIIMGFVLSSMEKKMGSSPSTDSLNQTFFLKTRRG